jgi:hypothetical protein
MKLCLYAFLTIAAGIWPLFHLVLTAKTGISPWRLGGWGMYSTPTPSACRKIVVKQVGSDERALTRKTYEQFPNATFLLAADAEVCFSDALKSSEPKKVVLVEGLKSEIGNYLAFPIESYRRRIYLLMNKLSSLEGLEITLFQSYYDARKHALAELEVRPAWKL